MGSRGTQRNNGYFNNRYGIESLPQTLLFESGIPITLRLNVVNLRYF